MNREILAAGLAWLGFVFLLGLVPWWLPPATDLPNTASMQGYNIGLGYLLVAGWTVVTVIFVWWSMDRYDFKEGRQRKTEHKNRIKIIELLLVAVVAMLFYWPAALARFGPHVEDTYFLMALWRMACGESPYTDFEFLYGPAMIYLPGWWLGVTGFSMKNYYSVLMIVQVLFFVSLMWILQRYIHRFLIRILTFLVLLPFFLDVIYGLNWIAWRYFAAVIVILILAEKPRSLRAVLVAGAIVGLGAAYSYEYAIAGLLSGLAILLAVTFEAPGRRSAGNLVALPIVAVLVWATFAFAITGDDFHNYLVSTLHVSSTASTLGLGQFAFRWTVHSLALFYILAGFAVMVGIGFTRIKRMTLSVGDLQLIGSGMFALVVLKIAFQRADHLHLILPFVPLIIVLLINQPRRWLNSSSLLRKSMVSAIVVVSLSHAVGQLPTGRWVVTSTVRGWLHELGNQPVVGDIESRRVGTVSERSTSEPVTLSIAARLNGDDLRDRSVLFYGSIWDEAFKSGVCPVGYSFYDILYSDDRKPLVSTVRATPDLLVMMKNSDYERLFLGANPEVKRGQPNVLRKIARVVSSVHFTETRLEDDIEYNLWKASLGDELRSTFKLKEKLGRMVLLERAN